MFSEENPTTSTVILTSPAAAGVGVAASPVVIQQQQLSPPPVFGSAPVAMTCPHCHAQISTSVSSRVGLIAWLLCILLAFIG